MGYIGYNLKFKKNSPFYDCVKTLATYRGQFPCLYCKIGDYIYGVFFSYYAIDSNILKKFCTDVKRVDFDSLSSVLPDIPYGFNGNFYTNNFNLVDEFYNIRKWSVRDMFTNQFYN